MKHMLYPDLYVGRVRDIPLEALYAEGIRGLILDIDNTLVPYFVADPTPEVRDLIRRMEQLGFRLFIVSNGKEARVARFTADMPIPYLAGAGKPGSRGFLSALEVTGTKPSETAVIGDQIFTDVWGGNRLSMMTILVKQVSPKDEWVTAIKRPLEKIVLYFYHRYLRNMEKTQR